MFIFVIFACLLLCLVGAAILAPCLQFAFKLVEGEKNSFRDAFLITFKSELACAIVSPILPYIFLSEYVLKSWLTTGSFTYESSVTIFEPLSIFVGIAVYVWLIGRELGDLTRSILIALVLTSLHFMIMVGLMTLVVAIILLF